MKNQYKDETGLFKDYNFKLVVIDALLDKQPSFMNELKKMKERYCETFKLYEDESPIEEMAQYFASLQLKECDLDKITELCFDGGNEIYFYICPEWDGEDDYFDIYTVEGYKKMKNLKSVEYISMCDQKILKVMVEYGIEVS